MKKGINIWSCREGTSIKECIQIAKRAGFDGIELSLNEEGELGLRTSDKEILEIKARLEEAELDIAGLATGLYWTYSMTSGNDNNRIRAMDICKKQLELASAFGVDAILVIPGAVGIDFIPGAEVVDYERAYDLAMEAIGKLTPLQLVQESQLQSKMSGTNFCCLH